MKVLSISKFGLVIEEAAHQQNFRGTNMETHSAKNTGKSVTAKILIRTLKNQIYIALH